MSDDAVSFLTMVTGPAVALAETRGQPSGPAEAELVQRARDGDREAFEELYRRHRGLVHGLVLARVPHPDVEDLVQDVFVTAMRRLNGLRQPQAFAAWLASIARNRATDHLRTRSRHEVSLDEDTPAPATSMSEAITVLAAIRRLPEAYRDTLVLRLVEGMTGPEIAERTGLTPGSVRVNLHRGMKLLRARLEGSAAHE